VMLLSEPLRDFREFLLGRRCDGFPVHDYLLPTHEVTLSVIGQNDNLAGRIFSGDLPDVRGSPTLAVVVSLRHDAHRAFLRQRTEQAVDI